VNSYEYSSLSFSRARTGLNNKPSEDVLKSDSAFINPRTTRGFFYE